jgi:hypothetical protein
MELYWKNYKTDRLVSNADTEAVHPPPLSCLVPQLETSEHFDYRIGLADGPVRDLLSSVARISPWL